MSKPENEVGEWVDWSLAQLGVELIVWTTHTLEAQKGISQSPATPRSTHRHR